MQLRYVQDGWFNYLAFMYKIKYEYEKLKE